MEVTLRGRTIITLWRMKPRHAFTLVEVLVALMLLGAAAGALVTAVVGDHRLRERAAGDSFAASAARARLEMLAASPCSGDVSGVAASARGVEHWSARASRPLWRLTDSIVPRRPAAPVVIEARVACPG